MILSISHKIFTPPNFLAPYSSSIFAYLSANDTKYAKIIAKEKAEIFLR